MSDTMLKKEAEYNKCKAQRIKAENAVDAHSFGESVYNITGMSDKALAHLRQSVDDVKIALTGSDAEIVQYYANYNQAVASNEQWAKKFDESAKNVQADKLMYKAVKNDYKCAKSDRYSIVDGLFGGNKSNTVESSAEYY